MSEEMEPFAKGKRGLIYLTTFRNKPALIKEKNPDSSVDTIRNEATMLQLLNQHGIGPHFFKLERNQLIREFLEGKEFLEYLQDKNKEEVLRVIEEVLYQCRTLDLLGINKFEMTRPYKHILVITQNSTFRKIGDVVQIDFERCRRTQSPKNVTQFLQCLSRGRMQELFKRKKIKINIIKIQELSKKYKQNLEKKAFTQILQHIGCTIRKPESFHEKVLDCVAQVPKGKITTYKLIAHALGTRAYRSIGQTLKKNAFSPRIPCHRVVASDGTIGGFFGMRTGPKIAQKKAILEEEGIEFEKGILKIKNFEKHTFSFKAKH